MTSRLLAVPRFRRKLLFIALSSLLLLSGAWGLAGEPDPASLAQALNATFTKAVEAARPAVVFIETEIEECEIEGLEDLPHFFKGLPKGRDFPFRFRGPQRPKRRGPSRGVGSGFIMDNEGHVLTNYHVIDSSNLITVKLSDGKSHTATVVGSDPLTDIALLKIETDQQLPKVVIGDSDKLKVGEWVIAIGNPFGFDLSVSTGIVSALGRADVGVEYMENFIQTDAAINVGNSGGPLVDLHGNVIGMNTAIASRGGGSNGVGFAIPINLVKRTIEQLLTKGKITRGMLGVLVQDLTEELAQQFNADYGEGVLVSQVMEDSAAQKAGIETGDIILEVNGEKVKSVRTLRYAIMKNQPGTKVKLDILRGGEKKTITVELGEMKSERIHARADDLDLGMSLQDLTEDLAREMNLTISEGVLVADVMEDSPAAEKKIVKGDVIREVNHRKVKSVEEYRAAVQEAEDNDEDSILLHIHRGNSARYVVLKRK